ncbi:MAG: hypothetical protein LQ350_004847 [Teloschistes chrysophthalmus]|nr:MAG: hypothetical protein LQ350_004847 [Niorma chrysophthalma]
MAAADNASFAFACVALGSIIVCTIPALQLTFRPFVVPPRGENERHGRPYEDEDGVATELSDNSSSTPLQSKIVLLAAFLGFGASIATASQSTVNAIAGLFFESHAVDAQFSASALSRWTFSWAGQILTFAKHNYGLDMLHVPQLHLRVRASYLESLFNTKRKSNILWKDLIRAHRLELIGQWLLAATQGVVQFTPQLAMYKLLELLQRRSESEAAANRAWSWVAALGVAIVITAWLESYMMWVVWARMGSPIRSELSALIFCKSTRHKDVKGQQRSKTGRNTDMNIVTGAKDDDTGDEGPSFSAPPLAVPVDEESDEVVQRSRQSVINLIAIDAKRISTFAECHYIFVQTIAKLATSSYFLIRLIGWRSLLAGFAASALSLPLNVWVSNSYGKTQSRLMRARDQKMAVMTEALQGIRQIKFSALESQWHAWIGKRRAEEMVLQRKSFTLNSVLIGIWILGPVMLSAISLTVSAVLHGDLSPAIAFTTITIFGQIESTLAFIPELTSDGLEAWVSLQRIGEYLDGPEVEEYIVPSEEIVFEDATVAWPSDSQEEGPDRFILKSIDVRFPARKLSVVSGNTGSGKSLLLAAILGEADKISGTIRAPRAPSQRYDYKANRANWIIDPAVAFVAQIPWIENATIRDNILFGLPFDKSRYDKVLSSCALTKDLAMLPDGELTDIGANGINLSGGQRWRITFARALYSRAGILILDDIFSAVDPHVGKQLFENALTGELGQGRTRILVTHHVGLCLSRANYAVSLSDGTVEHAGYVEDLQRKGEMDDILKAEQELEAIQAKAQEELVEQDSVIEDMDIHLRKSLTTVTELSVRTDDSEIDIKGKLQPKKFVEDEPREKGSVKIGIWKEYLSSSGGWWFWPPILIFFLFYQLLVLGRSGWISVWTRSYRSIGSMFVQQAPPHSYRRFNSTPFEYVTQSGQARPNGDLSFYLGIYAAISILICLCGTWRYYLVFLASLKASQKLFDKFSFAILRAPLRWLDTVPIGRILNRFTADFAVVDSRMGNDVGFMLYQVVQLVGIITAVTFVSPLMLLSALGLLLLCLFVASRFLLGAREVKRLESNAKSPIFEQFGSVLAGAVFSTLVAAVLVTTVDIDPALAGFALSFALQYSSAITWTIRQYTSVELAMNAMERIVEYSGIPIEEQEGLDVPAAWPTEGKIQIQGLAAGYAPNLPPVLKGLSFDVARNQRVGVVGRTGAGKSSLTLALFRFLEAQEGSIIIDGIDISKIRLHDLRSRLAIIPQDPVLFSGTVRSNLDAFEERGDAELYDALERVHLIRRTGNVSRAESSTSGHTDEPSSVVTANSSSNIFSSLSSRISEGGLNLSQGQRQLLCLARAIVSRPKIMVLDEATSAVDMATDVLIQRSIREEFEDSTLIVIAHRLSTIADFDMILLLSDGKAVEYDTPRNLMAKRGAFWEMVQQSGDRDRLEEIILGVEIGGKGKKA